MEKVFAIVRNLKQQNQALPKSIFIFKLINFDLFKMCFYNTTPTIRTTDKPIEQV
jgi:hypothetical protein